MPTIRFGGLTVLICAVLAWIFLTAGLATPMYKSKNGATTKITPFKMKIKGASTIDLLDAAGLCGKQKDRFRAIQAFGIISNILSIVVAVLGAAAAFVPDGLVALPVSVGMSVFAAAAVGIVTSVFTMIAWAIVAGTYGEKICGGKVKDTFDYGPTIGLWITAWIVLLAGAIVGGALGVVVDKVTSTGTSETATKVMTPPKTPPKDEVHEVIPQKPGEEY